MNMSNEKLTKIIPADSQVDYQAWDIPNVQSIAQIKAEQAGLVTAGELESMHQKAYEAGFNQGKEDGFKQAFEQGFEQGRQQGVEQGQKDVKLIINRFEQIMKFLSDPIAQVNADVEQELINLSLATAKQIVRREISMDPGQIVAVIKQALNALPSSAKNIKVYLHPDDAQIARKNLSLSAEQVFKEGSLNNDGSNNDGLNNDSHEFPWKIIEEPTITRGGCEIKTEFSQIDASLESRIAEISASILGCERSSDSAPISAPTEETASEQRQAEETPQNSVKNDALTDTDPEILENSDHNND